MGQCFITTEKQTEPVAKLCLYVRDRKQFLNPLGITDSKLLKLPGDPSQRLSHTFTAAPFTTAELWSKRGTRRQEWMRGM